MTAEQLHRAGQDYEAGATLRQLAKRYGVGKTYLRQHLILVGVQLRRRVVGGDRQSEINRR